MTWMIFSYFDDNLWSIMQATKVSDFTAEHEKHILELHETYAWIPSGKVIATEISAITGENILNLMSCHSCGIGKVSFEYITESPFNVKDYEWTFIICSLIMGWKFTRSGYCCMNEAYMNWYTDFVILDSMCFCLCHARKHEIKGLVLTQWSYRSLVLRHRYELCLTQCIIEHWHVF